MARAVEVVDRARPSRATARPGRPGPPSLADGLHISCQCPRSITTMEPHLDLVREHQHRHRQHEVPPQPPPEHPRIVAGVFVPTAMAVVARVPVVAVTGRWRRRGGGAGVAAWLRLDGTVRGGHDRLPPGGARLLPVLHLPLQRERQSSRRGPSRRADTGRPSRRARALRRPPLGPVPRPVGPAVTIERRSSRPDGVRARPRPRPGHPARSVGSRLLAADQLARRCNSARRSVLLIARPRS